MLLIFPKCIQNPQTALARYLEMWDIVSNQMKSDMTHKQWHTHFSHRIVYLTASALQDSVSAPWGKLADADRRKWSPERGESAAGGVACFNAPILSGTTIFTVQLLEKHQLNESVGIGWWFSGELLIKQVWVWRLMRWRSFVQALILSKWSKTLRKCVTFAVSLHIYTCSSVKPHFHCHAWQKMTLGQWTFFQVHRSWLGEAKVAVLHGNL